MDGAEFVSSLLTIALCGFYIYVTVLLCKYLIKMPEYHRRQAEAQERIAGALERKEQRELMDRRYAASIQATPRPTAPQNTTTQTTQPQQ